MQESLKSILIKLSVFSTIIIIIGASLFSTVFAQYYLPVFPFLLALFIIITAVIHIMLIKIKKNEMAKFARYFMLALTIKIFVFLIFLVSYVFLDKENAVSFLITFLVLFIVFLFYEVIVLNISFKS